MEIREIDYVLAICDCGSMSRAAEKLFITQSALSKYVQSLESRLGFSLFHREKKNRLTLTTAGEIYTRYARKIAQERDGMVHELSSQVDNNVNISVGMGVDITDRHFDEILRDFKQCYPNCNISIRTQRTRQNIIDMENGLLDFSECSLPGIEGRFNFYPVYDDYIQVAILDGHPLLEKVKPYPGTNLPWIDLQALEGEVFVMQDDTCYARTMIDQFLERNHFTPLTLATTNSTSAALRLVEKGVGLAFCTSGLTAGYRDIHFVNTGDPLFSFPCGIIVQKNKHISPQVQYLIDLYSKYNAQSKYRSEIASPSITSL